MHAIGHFLLHVIGGDSVTSNWYAFWSGFGSDIAEFALLAGLVKGFRRLKRHHEDQVRRINEHTTRQLNKLTDKNSQ